MASGESLITFNPDCVEGNTNGLEWMLTTFRYGISAEVDYTDYFWSRKYLTITQPNTIVLFSGILPNHYNSGGLKVKIYYSTISESPSSIDLSTETLTWNVSFGRVADQVGNIDSLSFSSYKTSISSPPAHSFYVGETEINFSNGSEISNIANGELFTIKVYFTQSSSFWVNIHKITIEEL